MPRIKRYITYLTLTLLASLSCHAQLRYYNVYVTNEKGEPLEEIIVYSFALRKNAESAYKEGMSRKDEGYAFDKEHYNLVDSVRTDNTGRCSIKSREAGAIILDGSDNGYKFEKYNIEDYVNKEDPTDNILRLKLLPLEEKIRKLDEVKSDARATPPARGPGIARRHGKNSIDIQCDFDIEGEYARHDARFVGFPIIKYHDFPDSVTYMPPAVVNGKDYARAMERRMGFVRDKDKLNAHLFDSSLQMENHQCERFHYKKGARILKGSNYYVPAIIWYEDNNGVYHKDSVLVQDGKEQEPMRFLNWESARKFTQIDRTKYEYKGDWVSIPTSESFKINFKVGEANIDFSDSITASEHSKMLTWLEGYYKMENGGIDQIVVRGYSSPEGSEATNRRLSKDRANTIINTLRARFPQVTKITPTFDSYDNIVPWDAIADSMMLVDDSISHSYAQEIKTLIQGKTTITEQNAAVRTNPTLYDYIKEKNLLSRMRRVEIEATIIEQRVLTRDEIVEKYSRDSTFRTRMLPYQYYHMMCHLADVEDWDELYKVSKEAYAKVEKTKVQKELWERTTIDSLGIKYPKETFVTKEVLIPYRLAGYYYALSTMRKGLVDTEILKPYLDDGRVNRGGKYDMNNLAFVVAQVLMYCQDESFDGANALIQKYSLLNFDNLTGLVMFVRCLNGDYDDPAVRDYVMSTSDMNKAVILAAIGKYREALYILYNGDVPRDDAKVEYLKAICHFQIQPETTKKPDKENIEYTCIWDEEGQDKPGINTSRWAMPMLEAFRLDPNNIKYIENDGFFNNAYRKLVLYFWTRMQAGIPIEEIAAEYTMLLNKMKEENKKKN